MRLTEFAVKEYRITLTVVVCFLLGGLLAFYKLPRSEDASIVFRFAMIKTEFRGASETQLENLVTRKIEEATKKLPEIELINSFAYNSVSVSVVKIYDNYQDIEPIFDRLRRILDNIRNELPDFIDGPYMLEDFETVYGILATVSSDEIPHTQLVEHAKALQDELLQIKDIGEVQLIGEQDQQIRVTYDDAEMADAGINPAQLKLFLESQNVLAPGGLVNVDGKKHLLEPSAELKTLQELQTLPILEPEQTETTPLEELLEIEQGSFSPLKTYVQSSGKPAICVAISMRERGNIEQLGKDVRSLLARLQEKAPQDLQYSVVAFEPDRVSVRINRLFGNLLLSLTFVLFILMLALGPRTGTIVAGVMPLVVIASLAIMYIIGLGLNLVSIAAFIVVLGMMVDNHIVIAERIIFLRANRNHSPQEAALTATKELHAPLLTAAFTTIAGFLPIYLCQTPASDYISPLFSVVAITLLCSELYGFTLTPLLSIHCFKICLQSEQKYRAGRLYRFYQTLLLEALKSPLSVLLGVALLLTIAIYSFQNISKIYFPPSDRPIFTMELQFPSGTPTEHVLENSKHVGDFVENNLLASKNNGHGITNWACFIGRNAPRFILNYIPKNHRPSYAYYLFNLESVKDFDSMKEQLSKYCKTQIPNVDYRILPIESGPVVGWPIQMRVHSPNTENMFIAVNDISEAINSIDGINQINNDWGEPVKKYRLVIDDDKAITQGATRADIALALQLILTGIPAKELNTGDQSIPIFIKANVDEADIMEKIENVHVYPRKGKPIKLKELAKVETYAEHPAIVRRDHRRVVTIRADVDAGYNPNKIDKLIAKKIDEIRPNWEFPIDIEFRGEGYEGKKSNLALIEKAPWAALVIALLLIYQARSFRRSFIILCSVPLGFIGVIFGLTILGYPFGLMSMVGMVALSGIVVNNAIIFMDRIRHNFAEGKLSPIECITESALNRLRPILLTTVTTIFGIAPLYLRTDQIWQPMATALIFGLICSTALTLFVLPVLYRLLFRIKI